MHREITPRQIRFAAQDRYPLVGTLYEPQMPVAAVLLSGGAAIPQRFYRHIAQYLASRGLAVLTYDYRGIGESAPHDLRGFDAPMMVWGTHDQPAAIDWLDARYPDLTLFHFSHSFGGQAFGMTELSTRFERSVMVASQSGYWRRFSFPEGYRIYLAMNVLAPITAAVRGYLPGKVSGFGEDMAWSTFKQWAYWCRQENYLFDDPDIDTSHYGKFTKPILSIGLNDDKWAPPNAIDALVQNYSNAKIERRQYEPKDVGAETIGHFGFFRPDHKDTMWQKTVDWLVADIKAT
ncbi:MAG: alpha/beta fold hydrolase [Fimbriimonadaceae bacterium]|nr:alpha/beta fold hydrolase [Alphaproteobacteria bacterium]